MPMYVGASFQDLALGPKNPLGSPAPWDTNCVDLKQLDISQKGFSFLSYSCSKKSYKYLCFTGYNSQLCTDKCYQHISIASQSESQIASYGNSGQQLSISSVQQVAMQFIFSDLIIHMLLVRCKRSMECHDAGSISCQPCSICLQVILSS